jgi:hypothetical protein
MALPDRDRSFEAGETIYGLGRPDVLRGLEEQAKPPATAEPTSTTENDDPNETEEQAT